MNVAVLVKQVPDSDEVKMDAEKGTMIRDGVGSIVNPLDLNAVDAAVAIVRDFGGSVTVISMGPPQADEALREAVSLGANRAVLLSDRFFAGADSWATSVVLAAALRKLGPFDLVLAGEKATDGETGQVGPEVAAILDLPFSTYVSTLLASPDGAVVTRTTEEGYQKQELPYPCLVTVLGNLNEPSIPTLAGKKRARRHNVERLGMEDLGLVKEDTGLTGSPTRVVKIATPKISRDTAKYSGKDIDAGLDAAVDALRRMAII